MTSNNFRNEAGLKPVVLKPQDIALALKILALENQNRPTLQPGETVDVPAWTLSGLAKATYISIGEVHNILQRLRTTTLLRREKPRINRHALEEFLLHGIQYTFPATRGETTRGIPTAYGAPMLNHLFLLSEENIPVWPHSQGTIRGIALLPLYHALPNAALEDTTFYELLALTDILRGDFRARERAAAVGLLKTRLS